MVQKTLMQAEPIKSEAKLTVADLPYFLVDSVIETLTKKRQDESEYEINAIIKDGVEYRMPNKVLLQCKKIKAELPKTIAFKVLRKGTTKTDTEYTIVPLESIPE